MTSLLLILQEVPWKGIRSLEIGVDITLAVMALLVVGVAVSKLFVFRRARRVGIQFAEEVKPKLMAEEWDAAYTLTEKHQKSSHLAYLVGCGLELRKSLDGVLPNELVIKHIEQEMERQMIIKDVIYKKKLAVLDAIGSTAPFVGALGGSAYTFAYGIILAIPAVYFASYLRSKVTLFEAEMRGVTSELAMFIERQMHQR
jgi:biopolymer transport protein ExbB/TolQ